MEALIFFLAGVATGAAANNHSHDNEVIISHSVDEVLWYDDCDVWLQSDVERLGNFIVTRNQRSEAQHLEGLNFFRDKYGNTSFNICYDALVTGTNG